jgi:hypothetical protein
MDELHEREAAHRIRPARGDVERQGGAPVLRDEDEIVEMQGIEKRLEVADVIDEAILDIRLAGLAIADQIRRHAAGDGGDVRDDVAPDERRRGIAVQE